MLSSLLVAKNYIIATGAIDNKLAIIRLRPNGQLDMFFGEQGIATFSNQQLTYPGTYLGLSIIYTTDIRYLITVAISENQSRPSKEIPMLLSIYS